MEFLQHLEINILPELPSFILQVISTLLVIMILSKFLWKPLKKYLDDKDKYIKQQYDDAEKFKAKGEVFLVESEGRVSQSRIDAQTIITRAKKEAEELKARRSQEAKDEAQRKIDLARRQIKDEAANAKLEIENQVAQATKILTEKLVAQNITISDQDKLIAEALDSVEGK